MLQCGGDRLVSTYLWAGFIYSLSYDIEINALFLILRSRHIVFITCYLRLYGNKNEN
jgi:hypothetical protein